MITQDRYIKFVIENYSDIEALNEVVEHAKKNLPELVNREVVDAILELEDGYLKDEGLNITNTKQELWWRDPKIYDTKGLYLGYDNSVTWFNLCSSDLLSNFGDQRFPPYLFLYVDFDQAGVEKDKIHHWITVLKKNRFDLRRADIMLLFDRDEFEYDDPYLVGRSLHKEINMNTIANRSKFRKQVQNATRSFTSTLLPILRGFG